jgi:hypothetical protein
LRARRASQEGELVRAPVVDVLLLNVPVALWADTDAHSRRVDAAYASRDGDVARRLTAILRRIGDEYVIVGESAKATLDAASARGAVTVDIAYPVPASAGPDFEELEAAYAAADADARARGEDDLTWPAECATFRRWYLAEITRQVAGGFPEPWTDG